MDELSGFDQATTTRPMMPTYEDEQRSIHQVARLGMSTEQWDDLIEDWLEEHIGPDRAQSWGIPDTSVNPLADLSRQLSTPGLYGRRNTIRHADKSALALTAPGGYLDSAGYYSRMMFVQYLTLALGDIFVHWTVNARNKLVMEIIYPHNVYRVRDPDDPSRDVQFWRLTRRFIELPLKDPEWIYVWEVYSLGRKDSDGEWIDEPFFRVCLADAGKSAELSRPAKGRKKPNAETFREGGMGLDVTDIVCQPENEAKNFVGENYPWWEALEDGTKMPIIPISHYQDQDTGQSWNWWLKRGIHRGTLNSALYWTYAGHCARDATGSYTIIAGLEAGAVTTRSANGNVTTPVLTKTVEPGTMEYHALSAEGVQPFVKTIGAGANLPDVVAFAERYEAKQAVRYGLNDGSATRAKANPTSAAALVVSNENKRDFSAQVEGVFRKADLETMTIVAVVLDAGGITTLPQSGYSVQYKQIPRSPNEKKEKREDLDWQVDRGTLSDIGRYQSINEGTTVEDATVALVQVAVEQERLKVETRKALVDANLIDVAADDAGGGSSEPVQNSAYNGAQMTAMQETAKLVNTRELGVSQARAMTMEMLKVSSKVAESMITDPPQQLTIPPVPAKATENTPDV